MSDKALQSEKEKLSAKIKEMQRPKDLLDEKRVLNLYNSMVWGIHNYYKFATHISIDCAKIQRSLSIVMKNRLGNRLSKTGATNNAYILKNYGASKRLRYLNQYPLCPIGYTQTKSPLYKKKVVYMYLSDRANKEGTCWPGINRIASDLEMSRSTVKRALEDLIKNGYIEKELRYRGNGSFSSNLYTILK